MDAWADDHEYWHVRRLWLASLLAVAAAVYLAAVGWRLSVGLEASPLVWVLIAAASMPLCGGLLALRRPDDRFGALVLLSGLSFPVACAALVLPTEVLLRRSGAEPWMWATMLLGKTAFKVAFVLAMTVLVTLPDGRARHVRERWFLRLAWIVLACPALVLVSNEFLVTSELAFPGVTDIRSPLFIEALAEYGRGFVVLDALTYSLLLGVVWLLLLRYRAAPTRERKQIRWVLFAGIVAVLVGVIPAGLGEIGVLPTMGDAPANILFALGATLIPTSLVVAVFEPPWLDVDVLIRKSFVYAALSVAILAVYVGAAAAPGLAGARLGLDVEVAVVLTVIIAVLFQPARRRLQSVADRWVFGARPSNYDAVIDFGVSIERAGEPSALLPRLVETIRTAIRLDWATAVLNDGTRAETGSPAGNPALRVPVGAANEQIGEIVCGPKNDGSWDDGEIQLVRTLAGQLGLAVMNARLAARIVEAAELERRRIERNIHDGVQQELVALVAQLGMARSAAADGALTPNVVDSLRLGAQQVLTDLRELAQGIHPSVLSDGGILEAVEERCARLPLQVTMEASEGLRARRFTDNIEGAAYFFITESLANVLKHAGANRVTVSVTYDAGRLLLGVADDGRGFEPDAASHNGLTGLRDRIRALGGTVTFTSRIGSGSRITAVLPVDGP